MTGRRSRSGRRDGRPAGGPLLALALALLLALTLLLPGAGAAQGAECSLADEIRGNTCRLVPDEPVEGRLGGPGSAATYRLDALDADTPVELVLSGRGGSAAVSVVDWRGTVLGRALRADGAPDVRLSVSLPLPGVYAVRVTGDAPPDAPPYRLLATAGTEAARPTIVWPPSLASGETPIVGERQVVRTPRGGRPETGVAVARALGSPPDGMHTDFTLVADVQFEQIVGPSALTVRFRYEPEAGGGSGYVLRMDPFAGTAALESFEEGQRQVLVGDAALPVELRTETPGRLLLRAAGPEITVTLDGQPVLTATDGRYSRGLIAVGTVTWSDPVSVTFDHLLVTTPAR